MKILFAGTPDCAIPTLELLAKNFELCGILTNPPAPIGRSKKLQNSQIADKVECLKKSNILNEKTPVFTPNSLDKIFLEKIKDIKPDILICFAYGKLFPKEMLNIFPLGGINIHPSLLPRWRGSTPIPAAILAGDKITGITIQTLANKMDEGDVLIQKEIRISDQDTTETLLKKVSIEAPFLLDELLQNFNNMIKNAKPQNQNEATYSSTLKKENGKIDWSDSTKKINRQIRAFTPWPGCFSYMNNKKINIMQTKLYTKNHKYMTNKIKYGKILGIDKEFGILVNTGKGILAISKLQKQSKKQLFWKDFLNGDPNFINGQFLNNLNTNGEKNEL